MDSFTKKKISLYDAKTVFESSGVGTVDSIKEAESGEFNACFQVRSNGRKYFIKFGTEENARVLSYERNMMATELSFYNRLDGTEIKRPEIFFVDTSREKVNVDYFIMEGYDVPLRGYVFPTLKDKRRVMYGLGQDLARLHSIKGEGYGYEQFGLENGWAEAYKKMIDKIIADATVLDVKLDTFRIYKILERTRPIMAEVESSLVHFDVWEGNVFLNHKNHTYQGLIDWERALWGDKACDLISLNPLLGIERNKYFVKGYRSVAPLEFDEKLRIRMNLAKMYLGLVMMVEAEVRWAKKSVQYRARRAYGKKLLRKAIKALEKPITEENL